MIGDPLDKNYIRLLWDDLLDMRGYLINSPADVSIVVLGKSQNIF